MGRSHKISRNDAELTAVQKLRHENDRLKKQISKLRKQLSRIDIDRYTNLKEMIEAHTSQDEAYDKTEELLQLKKKWICHSCGEDYLRVVIVPRADGMFYFRRCISCQYKTKLKKSDSEIEGIDSNDNLVSSSTL